MVTLFVRHKVADFDSWHRAFLGFADLNARHGTTNPGVFRGVEDPNDVTVRQDFASAEAAQNMLTSEEIGAALAEAGVVGPPSVWMVEQVG
jgi:hypothetical protein